MTYETKVVQLSNGVKLPYVEQGEALGVPLVLLHGFAGSWRSFQRLLPHLPDAFHTLALTQRGHGDATHPETGYGPQDYAADLAAFLDALHIQAAVIVGHSMGSAVAQRFAIDCPERTLGLVLASPRANMKERPGLQELYRTTISKLSDPVDADFVNSFVEGLFERPVPDDFHETTVEDAMKVPAHVWKRSFKTAMEQNPLHGLDTIEAPTLLVWGAEDDTVPQVDREAISGAIVNAQRTAFPGVGHVPHVEAPERFAEDLASFIKEQVKDG